jgi:Ca2+-binding RTX toxin-like protein
VKHGDNFTFSLLAVQHSTHNFQPTPSNGRGTNVMSGTVTTSGTTGTISVSIAAGANFDLASKIAFAIANGAQGGQLTPETSLNGPAPTLAAGVVGEWLQQTNGVTLLPKGYQAIVNTAATSFIIGSGEPSESVLSGTGNFKFFAPAGSGTVVAGGGNNTVTILPTDTGDWLISPGPGNNTILDLGRGNATVQTGPGRNTVDLAAGKNQVQLGGNDTLVAATGSATIDGTLAQSSLIVGGTANLLFLGGAGPVTLLGGSGSDTFLGGTGNASVQGGLAGKNLLLAGTGQASLFGGGNGDQLYAEGANSQLLAAGAGNETLSAAFAAGNVTLQGGSGKDSMVGGLGSDTFVAGTGSATMEAGVANDTFLFIRGHAGGADVIADFTSTDKVLLQGYGPNEVNKAIAGQHNVNGSATITLSDNTTITFRDVPTLKSSDFS